MITGRRAFAGASQLSTLASVLHTEPAPIREARDQLPREVERIIERCLRKDPRRRWQNVLDLKIALEDASQEWESTAGKETSAASTGRRGLSLFLWLTLTVVALAGGLYVGSKVLVAPPPTFQRMTFRRGNVAEARFAPDGTVLFSAQWGTDPTRIFSMQPGRNEFRTFDLPEGRILSVSSSGELAILLGSSSSGSPGTLA